MKRFLAILHARNIEFFRDKAALSWNILLPFFLVFGFAFIFSDENREIYKIGLHGDSIEAYQSQTDFFKIKQIEFINITDLQNAINKVKHHQLDMLISSKGSIQYWINTSSSKGQILERVLKGSELNKKPLLDYQKQTVDGQEVRYIDWVLPGILAMNMMFSCLFGIGYVIVRYRKNGVLKRLKATPLTAFEFITAQILSRLMLISVITALVFFGCNIFIKFYMAGSYFLLFFVFILGAFSLISLGLIVAARTTSEELANGVLNLFSWPMMIFSGVWFSLEGSSDAVNYFAQILPLTHIIDAARAVMNDGAGIMDIYPNLLTLTLMSIVFLFIGAMTFRWER